LIFFIQKIFGVFFFTVMNHDNIFYRSWAKLTHVVTERNKARNELNSMFFILCQL